MQERLLEDAMCHHAISKLHWCSLFRAQRTWLDSCPAAMGKGCRVASSKPDGSSFKHNCTFLSRYRKPIRPGSVAAFLTGDIHSQEQEAVEAKGLEWTDIGMLPQTLAF